MKIYRNMPKPDDYVKHGGRNYPVWLVRNGREAVQVSTVDLQETLFVGGDPWGDYIGDVEREIDERFAFYVDERDSIATVLDAIWDVKPDAPTSEVQCLKTVEAIKYVMSRIRPALSGAPWDRKHTHQVYKANARDLGEHIAEFETSLDADHAVDCVNAIQEIAQILEREEHE